MRLDDLRDWIDADFGVRFVEVTPIGHGADAAASVWQVTQRDRTRYAVKWSGGGSAAGLLLPARLAELGVDGVPAPVRTHEGGLWSERDGRRLSVQPWVADRRAVDTAMTPAQWTAYGALLARVHAVPTADTVVRALPVEDHRPDELLATTATVTARLGGAGDDGDDLVRGLAAAWRGGAGLLGALTARAAVLGDGLRDRTAHPVAVCHTDAHLGNVLLGDDGTVWLIDWDDATLAPPERDLMFVVGGLPGFAPVGARELAWFAAGYGPVDPDPDRLAYYRTVRALADLTEFAVEILDHDVGREGREFALRIVRAELAGAGLAALAVADHGA
ncbi:aminoglycoside phosphotransferase family protein [Jiangella ureilytica]|uniref:Aminoglycoside phosphotransferase family protein n=1 Tax=Jiangella ureilytica TaxID=2530374 RepID=A0A4R4RF64_9ACTN|nr:aminoglycoside phosphotransferase family protein [Jiangella ureilytica]TDC47880.1 aminoglycoside phosphotransferase family protein [Jiangella ureilytica]